MRSGSNTRWKISNASGRDSTASAGNAAVIADTSPIFYLLSIDCIYVLPSLFGAIILPDIVQNELLHPGAPESARRWASDPPAWIEIRQFPTSEDPDLYSLGAGERAAITLALAIHAPMVLIDERKGTSAALHKGLEAMGTLGILDRAAERSLIDLASGYSR